MRLRFLSILAAGLMAFAANTAMALGLGELELHSTLNEPFHGELTLQNAKRFAEGEIVITLAGQEEFQRQGLERHYFFNDFRFELVFTKDQEPRLKISSHQPVREPYLSFILEARWPSGKVQREYTVLLEKPAAIE